MTTIPVGLVTDGLTPVRTEPTLRRCAICLWPVSPNKPGAHENWCRKHAEREAQCPFCSKIMKARSIEAHQNTCRGDKPAEPKRERNLRDAAARAARRQRPKPQSQSPRLKPPMATSSDDDALTLLSLMLDVHAVPLTLFGKVNEWLKLTRELMEEARDAS